MTHREQILDFVRSFPGRNDDQISIALRIRPRQTVNQICRQLEGTGHILRDIGANGRICNYPSQLVAEQVRNEPEPLKPASVDAKIGTTADWFWEGNVIESLAEWLRSKDWSIVSQSDTRTKQRGVDLCIRKGLLDILIEAKGYPSHIYRDERRAGEKKPTSPTLQAQHWYSQALLKTLRLQNANPSAKVAMAFPDFPTYRRLFGETAAALTCLEVAVFFVKETGEVESFGI